MSFEETSLFENRINVNVEDKFIIKTGDELKSYNTERFGLKKRDFVSDIVDMCLNPIGGRKVIGVTGIRGTGKTVGLFHVIDELNDYENIVFIEVREKEVTMRDLIKVMRQFSCKHFFIDEISRINNFIEDSYYLDEWTNSGINVIVSGTNSYAITASRESGLFHRIVFIRTTHITFREQNRLTGISLDDYIKFGGILDKSLLEETDAQTLTASLVLDNLVQSIMSNENYFKRCSSFSNRFNELVDDDFRMYIKSIVFYIYYLIIISKISKSSQISLNRYTDKKNISDSRRYMDLLGVSLDFETRDFYKILSVLEDMNCVYRVDNIANEDSRFYITTPYLSYMLYRDFITVAKLKVEKTKTVEDLFEDITVCEIKGLLGVSGYYLDDLEIDSILIGSDNKSQTLIEMKSSEKESKCMEKASSLKKYKGKLVINKIICTKNNFEYNFKEIEDGIVMVPFSNIIEYLDKVYD